MVTIINKLINSIFLVRASPSFVLAIKKAITKS